MSENLPRQTLINTSPDLRQGELSKITVMMILDKKIEDDGIVNFDFNYYDDYHLVPFLEYLLLKCHRIVA